MISMTWAKDCHNCQTPYPSLILPKVELPEWPLELIKVEKEDYPRNADSSFCTRPLEMIDTVVIHHTETPTTTTPMQINNMHLNRGKPNDPWYMIGYSFLINSPYPGSATPEARVTEGRPLEIVGSHAGAVAFAEMNEEQKQMWDEGKIVCKKSDGTFAVDPNQIKDGKIKANITTIGLGVIGNYAAYSPENPGGYDPEKPRIPSQNTLDMAARLSCQLQKKYPRIKNIKWHKYYRDTLCPGDLVLHIEEIKTLAKGYGCDFN